MQAVEFKLPDNIKEEFVTMADVIAGHWYSDLIEELKDNNITSPIEQLFYADWKFAGHDKEIDLMPQVEIGPYRVDFLVSPMAFFVNTSCKQNVKIFSEISKELPNIIVELDGHQWHEKSPEQVERDKKRERFLVGEGHQILRFSGREIVRDTRKCVNEVVAQIAPIQQEVAQKWRKQGGW